MKNRKLFIGIAVLLVAGVGWYLFRPERLFINRSVNEALPVEAVAASSSTSATTLSEGAFHGVAHETKGTATLYQLADGKRVLRFTGFETSNGPDVQVYLGKAADASDNETVTKAGFYHLAALKGNVGDQNYELPADLDLSQYRSVTIWCRRFGVNFATAPLMAATAAAPRKLSEGAFHGVAHETKGTATLYQLADGKRVLRLSDFETSNGPEVQVYLGQAPDANDNDAVTEAGFVSLGALKGNIGDQNYEIPEEVDLSQYHSVTIWCHRFGVNFGTAPLES